MVCEGDMGTGGSNDSAGRLAVMYFIPGLARDVRSYSYQALCHTPDTRNSLLPCR